MSALSRTARDGLLSLARHTGIPVGTIADLADKNELRDLFGASGRLSTTAAPSDPVAARQRLLDLRRPPRTAE